MGLYRIWLDPRGVGRHAIGRQYPAAKPYHVDIEAPDMAAAKKRANSSPLWTGEITTLRSGDTKRAGAERRLYVGLKGGKRVIFRSDATPTKETHPQYGAVIGPFRTVRAARLMASPGCMLQTVAEAERVAGRQTRSGDTKRAGGGRAEREKSAWWATAPKDRRSDPPEVRVAGKWVTLSKMRPEALRSYQRRVVNELRRQTRESGRQLYGSTSRYRFSLSRNIQPPEEFRRNVRAMSREIRKTAWHPKYKPGQYVLMTWDEEGQIHKVSPGIPPGYIVVMSKSRYHAKGAHVFVPESMIKAHRRSPPRGDRGRR